jgi:hypothetical protein
VLVLSAHRRGDVPAIRNSRIGPALIFRRLWNELQIPQVVERLLAGRRFEILLERLLFLTVLHRPDCKQMVVGAILDGEGRPLCCELWPGNVTDVKTLIPVVDRLQQRFRIRSICIVADRGMISQETIAQLQSAERKVHFILGARLRNVKEIYEVVLSRGGRYREVRGPREKSTDPSPLKVKEVRVGERRYVVCLNEEQARKDRADRAAIVESLREQLKQGDKVLVGNKGYRKYLHSAGPKFTIDEEKVKWEDRFDGKWVLQTDLEMTAEETALQYKQLWMVEAMFRAAKTLLETRRRSPDLAKTADQ